MKRRIAAIAVGTVMALSAVALAGCGGDDYDGKTPVRIWCQTFPEVETRTWLQNKVDEFNATDAATEGNYLIELTFVPEDAWEQTLKAAQGNGTAPEITVLNYAEVALNSVEGYYKPLDDYMSESCFTDLLDNVNEMTDVNGSHYIYPWFIEPYSILFYRKSAFEEVGLDPEVGPASWDEMVEYARKLNKTDRYGIAMPNSSQLGWEAGGADGKAYVSQGDIWLSQWSPYDGIVQSVTLEAGQMYKITAYMRTYLISGASAAYDGLYSPVTVMVIEGDDESVSEALYADDSTDNLTVVAKQNVRFERDDAYMPVNLIFMAETAGTYSVFVGFEGGVENNIFQGGVQIGGVSMYKTSMEELSVEENNDDYSQAIVNTSSDVTVTATGITIGKAMTVSEFTDAVYAAPGYTMTIKDADGNAVTSGDMKSGYTVSVVKDGTEVASYAVTVNAGGTDGPSDPADPTDPTDPDANNAWVLPVVLSVVGVVVVAGVIVAVVLLKKKGKGSK